MTNMKKIITSFFIVTLLCYSNLSIKTNAQVNDSQSVTLLNDELEMQPGEIKTFTLYETTETTNEKTATAIARLTFAVSSDTKTLTWAFTPLTLTQLLNFTGEISQTDATSGLAQGTRTISGLLGVTSAFRFQHHIIKAHLSGTLSYVGGVKKITGASISWISQG